MSAVVRGDVLVRRMTRACASMSMPPNRSYGSCAPTASQPRLLATMRSTYAESRDLA